MELQYSRASCAGLGPRSAFQQMKVYSPRGATRSMRGNSLYYDLDQSIGQSGHDFMAHLVVPSEQKSSGKAETFAVPSHSWWGWLEGFIERMFIIFCLYALSIGPMYWQWVEARYVDGFRIIAAFYEPLRILGEIFPVLGEWLNWYLTFWAW